MFVTVAINSQCPVRWNKNKTQKINQESFFMKTATSIDFVLSSAATFLHRHLICVTKPGTWRVSRNWGGGVILK